VRLVRKISLFLWRPVVRTDYYGHSLTLPGQHDLALLANDLPLINTPLRRLAAAVRADSGCLRLLDVGANIGEGVPLADPKAGDRFWLVEGSATFLPYLRHNVSGRTDVTVIPFYLGEHRSVSRGAEVIVDGNAHINAGAEGEVAFETLDHLFPESADAQPNLIKIDVEGYEPRVLAGASGLLARSQPAVFMEWFPRLLINQGFDVLASIRPLEAAGYGDAAVYDNHGHFIGDFSLGDRIRLEQLAAYGRMRDLYYFDLAVFAPAHARLREGFRAGEARFFEDWLRRQSR